MKRKRSWTTAEQRSEYYLQLKGQLYGWNPLWRKLPKACPFLISKHRHRRSTLIPFLEKFEAIIHEIEDGLDPEIQRLTEEIGREKNEMARMDGSSRAAELADTSQQVMARIRRLTERYIRLKLATKILLGCH